MLGTMTDALEIIPVSQPIRGTIRPPGSKSLTNRALAAAAFADGESHLTGVLDSVDTQVMIESLKRLGVGVRHDVAACTIDVVGCAGRPPASSADLWLENSGTSIRFLTALCALGEGTFRLDGNARMRQRPIQDLVSSLAGLGVDLACELGTGCPPVIVNARGLQGGTTRLNASLSSQYLSGLLLAAPCAAGPIEILLEGPLVSEPYVEMTLGVMARFAVVVDTRIPGRYYVEPHVYRATCYEVEPDASAASYFFAAAAVTGGEVTIEGLSLNALQGDVRFVDALEQMGCRVDWNRNSLTVRGGELRGIEIDMNAISDTAQTLAAVAVFATGPTTIRNIAHVRHKETDRITALVTELRRLGLQVDEHPDGLTLHPGPLQPATIQTYDDHRMAMSFALVGLKTPGIRIADPGCTAKTYPNFFEDLEQLAGPARV